VEVIVYQLRPIIWYERCEVDDDLIVACCRKAQGTRRCVDQPLHPFLRPTNDQKGTTTIADTSASIFPPSQCPSKLRHCRLYSVQIDLLSSVRSVLYAIHLLHSCGPSNQIQVNNPTSSVTTYSETRSLSLSYSFRLTLCTHPPLSLQCTFTLLVQGMQFLLFSSPSKGPVGRSNQISSLPPFSLHHPLPPAK
jgi:hypothetical protein